jgi:hypothetical protein
MRFLPILLLVLTPVGLSQAFNIDCNPDLGVPTQAYGAAAQQPGEWNSVSSFSSPASLVDTSGAATGVTLEWPGFHFAYSSNHVQTSGNDEALMDDLLDGPDTYKLVGLAPGTYDVFTYAWAPDDPQARTGVSVPGGTGGAQSIGGSWTGGHVQGVTFAKHSVTVGGSGELTIVITVASKFASLNGIQIEPQAPTCPIPISYCTAKVNSCGSVPAIGSSGIPSAAAASGFVLTGSKARMAKAGLVLYTPNGPGSSPFQGGLLCVSSQGLRRGSTTASTGGSGPVTCDAAFSMDWASFASGALGGSPQAYLKQVGTKINVQWWGRDTQAAGSYLTNGLEYTVCP